MTNTVAELITQLQKYPSDARWYAIEQPEQGITIEVDKYHLGFISNNVPPPVFYSSEKRIKCIFQNTNVVVF